MSRWVACVALVVLSGCGGGGGKSTGFTLSPTSSTSTTSSTVPATTTTAGTGTAAQTVTVTPATGLKSGQKVTVTGVGFSPNEALVVNECADKGTATGSGDCNLNGMVNTTSDANGKVHAEITVVVGPFGSNQIVCGANQSCLVSVSQATFSPTEEASAPISFG